ncbi:hypothetical protein MSG28_004449 [Choristoneura fumiferana]|uniref:Uncharacterized protein n=1 Tax=Choristoneura fumiferana TaxID=7141 RepID=A0ACC0K675_CHOFU|nr:hypothetical protein MSG28_004449 [Choristoneura fumiferana]
MVVATRADLAQGRRSILLEAYRQLVSRSANAIREPFGPIGHQSCEQCASPTATLVKKEESEGLLDKLDRLQNVCIRYIFGLRKYDHVSNFRVQLKWLPIRDRRNIHVLSLLFNTLFNPSAPVYLSERFSYLAAGNVQPGCAGARLPARRQAVLPVLVLLLLLFLVRINHR